MSITFLLIAILAGALTVLAPCILPLLPVVIGSSVGARSKWTPYIVIGSLGFSILIFTLLLKASTAFITVPQSFWTWLSAGILILFGLILLFPSLWDKMPGVRRLSVGSNKLAGHGHQAKSVWGDVLIGASLGPIFSSCSPTYFVILATVLPESYAIGLIYLLGYIAGLSIVLLLIVWLGQTLLGRLMTLADGKGWFKRGLGALFVLLGFAIGFGLDKAFETWLLDVGVTGVTGIENSLLERILE